MACSCGKCGNCHERPGYTILRDLCPRCARDTLLHDLNEEMDRATLAWVNMADLIYRHEVMEGTRVPPAIDRAPTMVPLGELRTGLKTRGSDASRRSSPSLKQVGARSSQLSEDDL